MDCRLVSAKPLFEPKLECYTWNIFNNFAYNLCKINIVSFKKIASASMC